MSKELWGRCLVRLEDELPSPQFNMWIRPLEPVFDADGSEVVLLAPNRFVQDWVKDNYLERISDFLSEEQSGPVPSVRLAVGTNRHNDVPGRQVSPSVPASSPRSQDADSTFSVVDHSPGKETRKEMGSTSQHSRDNNLTPGFTFESFIQGKSNQMARATAMQVAENPGTKLYNPLLFYGDVGLGKTHLMQAVGNYILKKNPSAKVVYLHSERFVTDMIRALRMNTMNEFKRYYRSVDVLLIDDIQFFAGKQQSQEEFFHTFNSLLEAGQQMIMTCDKYPKEIEGLEDRLKSRFGWGLAHPLEPPELETRVAILKRKAEEQGVELPNEAAFFMAQVVRSNVRELEGALKRVLAQSKFTGSSIDVSFVKHALKDLLAIHARQVTIENIQRTVAEYFKIKVADLLSARRTRSVARPRQVAMALSKELTNRSYPEIGDAFGGRDHTTVIHACKKVKELRQTESGMEEDYQNLLRSLTS